MDILYIVVPCYNEQEVLPETAKRLKAKMTGLIKSGKISQDSRIVFVNDGSKDETWRLIKELHEGDSLYSGICLSRNKGHQNALMAGLMTAYEHADMVISMDADLQDDIEAVDAMVERYKEGCDVVYGVRGSRETDSAFKRMTAESYYKLIQSLGGDIIYNHADYRLLSKRALGALAQYGEVNMFLRGIVPMLGFKSAVVEYDRSERFAGESKYPLKKMIAFAVEGITSLSVRPLRLIMWTGVFSVAASAAWLLVLLIRRAAGQALMLGALGFALMFFAGLNLIASGIIGEYIGKIYLETKRRPLYFIETVLLR